VVDAQVVTLLLGGKASGDANFDKIRQDFFAPNKNTSEDISQTELCRRNKLSTIGAVYNHTEMLDSHDPIKEVA